MMTFTIFLPDPDSQRGENTEYAKGFLDMLHAEGRDLFVSKGFVDTVDAADASFMLRIEVGVSDHDTCAYEIAGEQARLPKDIAQLALRVAIHSVVIGRPIRVIMPCRHVHELDASWVKPLQARLLDEMPPVGDSHPKRRGPLTVVVGPRENSATDALVDAIRSGKLRTKGES